MLKKNRVLQDRYKIREIFAQAGMGNLYRAEDLKKEGPAKTRWYVIKEPRRLQDGQDHIREEKIKVEIEVLKKIDHPNIVNHIDDFEENNQPYLVQEYLEGRTLYEVGKEGPLLVDFIKNLGIQILDALTYLHSPEQNIIHRDIKPRNFILSPDRKFITLLDFGSAKAGFTSLSLSNQIHVATPGYSAPEQIKEDVNKIGAPADIYGVGTTLFYLATGENPRKHYQGGSVLDGRLRRADEVNPVVPTWLGDVIAISTHPIKTKRYLSAEEMKKDLLDPSTEQLHERQGKFLVIGGKKYQLSDYSLDKDDPLTIGRDGDIIITDPKNFISRIHCSIYKDEKGKILVEDGGRRKGRRFRSRNGTYVYLESKGGFKEIDRWALQNGDRIALGYKKEKGPWLELRYRED